MSDLKQGKNGHFDHAFIQPGTGSHRAIKQEKKQRASNLEEEVKLSLFVGDMISIQKTRKAKWRMSVIPESEEPEAGDQAGLHSKILSEKPKAGRRKEY